MKNKYARFFIIFLLIMVALTVLARAADAVTVAKVRMTQATRGTLVHQVTAEGSIKAADQTYVQSPKEGFIVEKIHVAEGESVEKGAILFTLDGQEAEDQLQQVQNQRQRLALDIQKLQTGNNEEKTAVENAQRELERAKADEELQRLLNDGHPMQKEVRAVEDAKAAFAEAQSDLTQAARSNELEISAIKLEMEDKDREIIKLQKICDANGVIVADEAGVVAEIMVRRGEETGGRTLCAIAPADAELLLEAEFPAEEAKYMKAGDPISVVIAGKSQAMRGVTIKSLKSTGSVTTITARLPREEGTVIASGSVATVTHESVSEEYPTVIPLSALRGGSGSYYVLLAQEKNSVLGKEITAMRMNVELIDKDRNHAALAAGLNGPLIHGENKPIDEGDRVREVSQ